MCGRRCTCEVPILGKLADALMAGGVVMGKRHARDSVDRAALATYSTSLLVNGVEVASGATSQCPQGGPVESLTWYVFRVPWHGPPIKEYMHAHALHMRTHARTHTRTRTRTRTRTHRCANHLLARGLVLKQGHLVITGATAKSKAFQIGDTCAANLGALGSVETVIAP